MKLTLYQIDAFTDKLFGGNPAAVVPLKKWIDDELMQKLAMENNLAETVFFTSSKNKKADIDIRWFTPALEINLCGHATLAAAYVIFEILKVKKKAACWLLRKRKKCLRWIFRPGHRKKLQNIPIRCPHRWVILR